MRFVLFSWLVSVWIGMVLPLAAAAASTDVTSEASQEEGPRLAVVLMLTGKADCTVSGQTKPLELGMQLPEGASLRTHRKSEVVLFFRQIGTMIRLRANTSAVLEKMAKHEEQGVLLKDTVIDLRQGELMCVVRVLVKESHFEIRTPHYRVAFDGAGLDRLDLNADGTVLVGKQSDRPMRVRSVADESRQWVVKPGEAFLGEAAAVVPASERMLNRIRPKLDELHRLGKALTPRPKPNELRPPRRPHGGDR